jgi:hypothetical protein
MVMLRGEQFAGEEILFHAPQPLRRDTMGSTFRIHVHPSCDSVHLRLEGHINGLSAHELIEVLKRNCRWAARAFIHTSNLESVHPSARMVLEDNLGALDGKCLPLFFTGKYAGELAPRDNEL